MLTKLKTIILESKEKLKENNHILYKMFFSIFILYILFYSSIIRANADYANDLLMQIHYGYNVELKTNKDLFLPFLLRMILPTRNFIYDISPFLQIAAAFFLALSAMILINTFSNFKKSYILKVVAGLIIGLNPAFLECISSKFDAMYYAMGIFFSLLPLTFYKKNGKKYIIMTFLSLLFSFCLSCSSSGIYIVSVIFLSVKLFVENEDRKYILNKLLISVFVYLSIVLVFLVILNIVNNVLPSKYLFTFNNIFILYNKLISIYKEILTIDFIHIWSINILILFLIVIAGVVINSKQNKIITFLLVMLSMFLVLMFQFGIIPIIINNANQTGRFCIGYGVTLSILILFCVEYIKKLKLFLLFPIMITWCFCIYAIHFGNLLGSQKDYNNVRLLTLVNDIDNMPIMKTVKGIKMVFCISNDTHSPLVIDASSKYKGITKLIPCALEEPNYFKYHYYRDNIEIVDLDNNIEDDLLLYLDTYFHKIETNEKDLIKITLK